MTLPGISFGGLASGIDTTALIDQIVEAERIPIVRLETRRQGYEAKDEAWQTVTTRLSALRTVFSPLDAKSDFGKFASATSSEERTAVARVNGSATPGSVTFTVDQLATSHQMASATTFSSPEDLPGNGMLRITVEGVQHNIRLFAGTTLAEAAVKVNDSDIGVTASVVGIAEDSYKLVLTASETGASGAFTVRGIAQLATFDVLQAAQDAELTLGSGIGALGITRSSNTIADLLPGVAIELKAVSLDPVTVTTSRDVEATVEAVQAFVDELNETMTNMTDLTSLEPGTEVGAPLFGDTSARRLINEIRFAIAGTISAASEEYAVPSSIGLSLTRDGTFAFDSDKLRTALDTDFAAVRAMFGEDGLGGRLDAALDAAEGIDGSITRARDRWRAEMDLIDDHIAKLEDRVDRKEAELVREFAALETAISSLTAQSNWLAATLPSGLTP